MKIINIKPWSMNRMLIILSFMIFNQICKGQNQFFSNYTNWGDVKASASAENKQILLYFGAPWCAPCNQLLKGVFADSATKVFLKNKFMCYAFDFDQDNAIAFLKKYRITTVPFILILNNQGYLKAALQSIPQEIQAFTNEINNIAETNSAYKGINNELELNYPHFYDDYFDSRLKRIPDSSSVTNYLKSQTDLFSEVNWDVISLLNTNEYYFDFLLSNKEKFRDLYGREEVSFKLYYIYTLFFDKYTKSKDSVGYNKIITKYIKKEGDSSYVESLKSFYMKEIRFLGVTGMDWNKFISKAKTYIQKYGESNNHFICNYAYDSPSMNDTLNEFLLQIMKPVLERMPYLATYLMYGVILLKLRRPNEAEIYFKKIQDSNISQEYRLSYQKRINTYKKKFM
jgi:thiol-disulfide isomerase/thioredoxin